MAKLPSAADLGGLPSANSGRPIATYDSGGIARGMAAQASEIAQSGAAFAGGLNDLGKGINSAVQEVNRANIADDVFQATKAKAAFVTAKINRDSELQTDQDIGTMQPRYEADLGKYRDQALGMVNNPRLKEKLAVELSDDYARGIAGVKQFAFRKTADSEIAQAQSELKLWSEKALSGNDEVEKSKLIAVGQDRIAGLHAKGYISAQQEQELRRGWIEDYGAKWLQSKPAEERARLTAPAVEAGAGVVDRIMAVEWNGKGSSQNPNSSARGPGQFIDSTWLMLIREGKPELAGRSDTQLLALKDDKNLSREMVALYAKQNGEFLQSHGVDASPGNIYLAHFLGPATAARVLKATPNTPVSEIVGSAAIEANQSVLRGKTVGTVAAWASNKMGGAGYGKTGTPADFVPFSVQAQVNQHAQQEIAAGTIEQQRAAKLQTQQIKEQSDAAEHTVMVDLYSDNPKQSLQTIVNNPKLTTEARQRLMGHAKSALADDKTEKTYGKGFYDAYQAVHAPAGSPGRITDPTELYKRVGPDGDLTVQGVDKLVTEISGRRSPEGVAEGEMKAQFLKNARSQISGSDEGLKIKDPKGDELYLKFMAQTLPAYEKGRKDGKSAAQLLNPDSPDYVGKSITQFKRPMNQWFADVVQDDHAKVADFKTLDDLVSAYRSGKVTKAMADELAVSKGWAQRRPQVAPPAVPISGDEVLPGAPVSQ